MLNFGTTPPRKRQRLSLEPEERPHISQHAISRPSSQASQRGSQTEKGRMDRLKAIADALGAGRLQSAQPELGKENLSSSL